MKKILTFLLAALGLTSACGQDNFENTDVQDFAELMADSNVVVLDVRTVDEFSEGHIDGAMHPYRSGPERLHRKSEIIITH